MPTYELLYLNKLQDKEKMFCSVASIMFHADIGPGNIRYTLLKAYRH